MIVSLNEIESTVLKAVRGAGFSWGLAEEASQAARWLAARGISWERELIRVLSTDHTLSEPVLDGTELRPATPGAKLSPINAGAAISDLLGICPVLTVRDVIEPVWLLPFAHRHSHTKAVTISWSGRTFPLPPTGTVEASAIANLQSEAPQTITITCTGKPAGSGQVPECGSVTVHDAAWRRLEAFAARTYVPASDQSRLAGAGAGLSDND
jgi:hypothetical protein